ncbi:MAG TPA: MCE family protein [Mycobacteriales bacterium]|nr:MCE family protein [Mycobacteriales bacterium]
MTAGTRVRAIAALCVVALVGGLVWWQLRAHDVLRITAHFTRTVGLYPGSDVRILGVKVGTVGSVQPEGGSVRVELEVDGRYHVPARAGAAIVAPSLVSDRYVQLTPVYTGGPTMASGTDLGLDRTAAPVELDELYKTTSELAQALGPNGANAHGALSRLVDVGAANLDGTGRTLSQTLHDLSAAVQVVGENRENLFGTIGNLQTLATALANSDRQVRAFNVNLADVAGQLADERASLGVTLANLASALSQVVSFIKDNRALVKRNVTGLAQLTGILVKQRDALAEFFDLAPVGLANLNLATNPLSGTLDVRANLEYLQDPTVLCALLVSAGVRDNAACNTLARLVGGLPKIPGLNAPGDPNAIPTLPGLPSLPTAGGILSANGVRSLPGVPGLPALPGLEGGG